VRHVVNKIGAKPLSEEKLEFTRQFNILGNIWLFAWVLLAFFGVLFYSLIYGWFYLIFEAAVIYGILRRLGCGSLFRSNCYECEACTGGFGRLAGAFFGRGFIKKESVRNRIGLIAFVYFLLLPLPATLLVLSMPQGFSVLKLLVLVCLLATGAYSLATWSTRSTVNH
jgi:hypothetical protein